MIKFDYIPASSLKEACSLISQYQDVGKVLAGGQSLVTMLRQRLITPEVLIDIYGIKELDYLQFNEKDGLRMGPLTKHRILEKSPLIKEKYPVLSELEKSVASVQTRNWGTIGGNICCADPMADPIPALIALGTKLKLVSTRGERIVSLENFFLDFFTTVVEPDELLAEIQVPPPEPNSAAQYMKFSTIEAGIKIVSVSILVTVEPNSDICKDVKIVMSAVAPTPLFARKASEVLKGKKLTDSLLNEVANIAAGETDPTSDIHASAEFRKEIVKVLVKRATKKAFERAKAA